MNGKRRMSRRKGRRQIGAATNTSVPRWSCPQISNRQIPLVEAGLSCGIQTVGPRSNRQILRGSAIFRFQISNLKFSISVCISIRQDFRAENAASHSKQTIGVRAIRQFFGGVSRANKRQALPAVFVRKSHKTNNRGTKQVSIFCVGNFSPNRRRGRACVKTLGDS